MQRNVSDSPRPPDDRNLRRKTDRYASNYDSEKMEINALLELDMGERDYLWWEVSDGFMVFQARAIKET